MRTWRLPIVILIFLMAGLVIFYWILTRGESHNMKQSPGQGDMPIHSRAASAEGNDGSSSPQELAITQPRGPFSAMAPSRKKARNAVRRKQLLLAIRAAKMQRELARFKTQSNENSKKTGLSGDYIKEIVATAIPEVKACYGQVLKEVPDLAGKLIIRFTISGEPDIAGLVDELEVTEESDRAIASNEMMSDCIADTILSLEFDPPKNGGTVEVSYPFTFRLGQD